MLVPAVDQHVALGDMQRHELVDQLIHRLPRLDHHHDLAGRLDGFDQLFEGVAADEVLALGPAVDEVVHLLGGAIENRDVIAAAFDIEGEVLAHDGETDETEVGGHRSGAGSEWQRLEARVFERAIRD